MHLRRSSRPLRTGHVPGTQAKGGHPGFRAEEGWIEGCRKDGQTVGPDWLPVQGAIDGVAVREVRHLIKERGVLTAIFRVDWELAGGDIGQVFEVRLAPGEVTAWHVHRFTLDRLFITHGDARIVLYDARSASPTHGRVNEFHFGGHRPALVVVPSGVWHGLQSLGDSGTTVLNLVDRAYSYEDPDHWRLPPDTARIPYRFPDPPTRAR